MSQVVFGVMKLITSPAYTVRLYSIVPAINSDAAAANVPPAGTAAVAVREHQHQPLG